MAYDVSDFQREVLERSFSVPVLVDFWAEWCGPCKILGPLLERLAGQGEGQWELAKVDTEAHPEIAQQYRIQSIPNVKLFVDGVVIDEFVGALPEYQLQAWLKKAVPGRNRKLLAQAEAFLASGDDTNARRLLEQIPSGDPDYTAARVLLSRSLAMENPSHAATLIADVDDPAYGEIVDTVRTLAHLHEVLTRPESLPNGESRTLYLKGIQSLFARDYGDALTHFIALIRADRYFDDDGSRKACIAIFKLLGEEHAITQQYRREFSSALY